jgi:hypothetical protein
VAWSHNHSGRITDAEFARALARKLCRDSLTWSRTFVISLRPSQTRLRGASDRRSAGGTQSTPSALQLEHELLVEILAYGLCLLEMRLSADPRAGRKALVALVKHECGVLMERARWRRRTLYRRLPPPSPAPSGSRYAQIYPTCNTEGRGQARLTRAMFEQFCRCTGLGSDVLVGTGENLASLVFYIAVHGVLSAGGLPTREEVLKLLLAARECRAHLQRAVSTWVAAEPKAHPPVAALPDSGSSLPTQQPRSLSAYENKHHLRW